MGWGDEVMASGEAYAEHKKTGLKVRIRDYKGLVRPLHMAWQNVEFINQDPNATNVSEIVNSGYARGYLKAIEPERMVHNRDYRAKRGVIQLNGNEQVWGLQAVRKISPFVLIEPHNKETGNKAKATINKQWGAQNWIALAARLQADGYNIVQIGPNPGPSHIKGIHYIQTPTMRNASAIVAHASAAVLPEGGLHHTAAAFHVPAVVVFGGFTAPSMTGYEGHINIGTEDTCGSRIPCEHCRAEMNKITVEQVYQAFKTLGVASAKL